MDDALKAWAASIPADVRETIHDWQARASFYARFKRDKPEFFQWWKDINKTLLSEGRWISTFGEVRSMYELESVPYAETAVQMLVQARALMKAAAIPGPS